jgi:cold shock CspA family protein
VTGSGRGPVGGQRFGHITDRKPSGSGPSGRLGTYFVRDDETGTVYSFSYADIVTEGFRTLRTGERVRFLTDQANNGHASYVIRLDMPDVEEYYV